MRFTQFVSIFIILIGESLGDKIMDLWETCISHRVFNNVQPILERSF